MKFCFLKWEFKTLTKDRMRKFFEMRFKTLNFVFLENLHTNNKKIFVLGENIWKNKQLLKL